jgi:hypothetical protein
VSGSVHRERPAAARRRRRAQAEQAVGEHQGEAQQAVEQQDVAQGALVARREQPLRLALVAAVVGHVQKQPAEQHGPEAEVALPLNPQSLSRAGAALGEDLRRAPEVRRQPGERQQHGGEEQEHLHHVGDHHRAHAAHDVVGDGDAHQQRTAGR